MKAYGKADSALGRATKSILPLLVVFTIYSISLSMTIPAAPLLMLEITGNQSGRASILYGASSFLKYLVEFFSSPLLGNYSDSFGRKPMLLLSLAVVTVELIMLGVSPHIAIIFITRAMSGALDCTTQMLYAAVIDISSHNNENATKYFGYLGACFGLGFIIGPLLGSYIAELHLAAVFLLSAALSLLAMVVTYFFLEETLSVLDRRDYQYDKQTIMAPVRTVVEVLQNPEVRKLAVPYGLSSLNVGIYFIWIYYMKHHFSLGITSVGKFLSLSGFMTVLVQGFAVQFLVPRYLSDEVMVFRCFVISALQNLAYGLCGNLEAFYIVMLLSSISSSYGPCLRSLLAATVPSNEQGKLQGALNSLRTLFTGSGSLLYTAVYTLSIHESVTLSGLPFFVASAVYVVNTVYYYRFILGNLNSSAAISAVGNQQRFATGSDSAGGSTASVNVLMPANISPFSVGIKTDAGSPRAEESTSLLSLELRATKGGYQSSSTNDVDVDDFNDNVKL